LDISKLKDGIVDLSVFFVSHGFWLFLTVLSTWAAFGSDLQEGTFIHTSYLTDLLESETAKLLVEDYGLKPLIPIILIFVLIFVLYFNAEILRGLGQYIPPEIAWHWMPGFRDVGLDRWYYVIGRIGSSYSFQDIREIIESRHAKKLDGYGTDVYFEAFRIFKALAFLNFCFFLMGLGGERSGIFNLALFVWFASAAVLSIVLHIYHRRNQSHWAIEEILRDLLADRASARTSAEQDEEAVDLSAQSGEAAEFATVLQEQPLFSLTWTLPLIGNMSVLASRFRHRDAKWK